MSSMRSFGSVDLSRKGLESLYYLSKAIASSNSNYPKKSIKISSNMYDGLRPLFCDFANNSFHFHSKVLLEELSKKLELVDPVIADFCDCHSSFYVNWHSDSSDFDPLSSNRHDISFFSETRRCLKIYFKMPLSFLDLKIKVPGSNSVRLSGFNKISYFDVRLYHKTYFSIFNIHIDNLIPNFIRHFYDRIEQYIISTASSLALFRYTQFANVYFLVYEDAPIFREYEQRERRRASEQISN